MPTDELMALFTELTGQELEMYDEAKDIVMGEVEVLAIDDPANPEAAGVPATLWLVPGKATAGRLRLDRQLQEKCPRPVKSLRGKSQASLRLRCGCVPFFRKTVDRPPDRCFSWYADRWSDPVIRDER